MNIKRTLRGVPTIVHPERETHIVAADAIALLSGVNYASVEKVIAAMAVLVDYSGTDPSLLMNLSDVPTKRVVLSDPSHASRAANTRELCEDIAASGRYHGLEDLLHLTGRFQIQTDV